MSSQPLITPPPKPTLPPFWKWLMRITFAVTMILFLAPAGYVLKYYALDRPREAALAAAAVPDRTAPSVDYLPALEKRAQDPQAGSRPEIIQRMGSVLRQPGIGWKRPLECLSAKAALASLATKDSDPAVRTAAAVELGKVAQGGAVIRR